MNTEFAQQQIADFRKRFGEAHLYFAYHAAFPVALTPDLAYRVWANFQRDKDGKLLQSKAGRVLQIPWIAVADLLLSGLCKEVAHELYEMDLPVRNELLSRLRHDERFGRARIHELAKFVEHYFEQQLQSEDLHLRNLAKTQNWSITAYLNPNQIAEDLARQLAENIKQNNKAGIARLTAMVDTVQESLIDAGLEEFVTYSDNMQKFARGNAAELKAYIQKRAHQEQILQPAGIGLPLPEELDEKPEVSESLVDLVGSRMQAVVERYDVSSRYGYIATPQGADVYFKSSFIREGELSFIKKGILVEFTLKRVKVGYQAHDIFALQKDEIQKSEETSPLAKPLYLEDKTQKAEGTSSRIEPSASNLVAHNHEKTFQYKKFYTNFSLRRIQPTIVIGLGGTGVKTITYLKKILQEQAENSAQFVRFLAIDIDELKGEVPSASLFGENIRLNPEKNEFFRITDKTRGDDLKKIPSISSWFPEEGYKYLPLTEGARQAKPIGRLGFYLSHNELSHRLHRLSDRFVTPQVLQEFPSIKAGELNIYVVSSICGGTGAGLFLDIAYELRYLQQQNQLPNKSRIKGLFATGDVYDAVSKRVQANTYASLRELNWIQKENATFHPVYPDETREVIHGRAFDTVYLFGDKNHSDIEISSPYDFAKICAEFILLDSGADVQETGDSLSKMIQWRRNDAEVYTMNYDADGTPRCYSSLGFCKIRFPIDRISELCATRICREIIEYHIIGRPSQDERMQARRKVKEFITNEGLGYFDNSSELPDRLIEKILDSGERIPFGNWVTKALDGAYNNDIEEISKLEIRRFTSIVDKLNSELNEFQADRPNQIIAEMQNFQKILDREIKQMFLENLGVNFVVKFLEELLESAKKAEDYVQTQLQSLLKHEERLSKGVFEK